MPLIRCFEIGKNSEKHRFDWPGAKEALEKLQEEIQELQEALEEKDSKKQEEELGDCFFALVQVSRHLNILPDKALKKSNEKFEKRFEVMEKIVRKEGKLIKNLTLDEMHVYWEKAKKLVSSSPKDA